MKYFCLLSLAGLAGSAWAAPADLVTWDTRTLTTEFHGEGAAVGDFNRDGHQDVVSGPHLFFGPDFAKNQKIYESSKIDVRSYSRNFLTYAHDLNGDGWDDVIAFGFPGEEAYWFKNTQGKEGLWPRYAVLNGVDNESPHFTDVTGDGKPEIVCSMAEKFGYAEPNWADPTQPWRFTSVSAQIPGMGKYTHGLGISDVDQDGRLDIVWKDGWWGQTADPRTQPVWTEHKQSFGGGGSQMYAYDLDGDGDNDVLTSLAAHGYGLSWFENLDGKGAQWKEHLIMGDKAETSPAKVAFSQHHSLEMADIDGDGVLDFVTGKRWFAHNGADPGGMDPAVIYWFKTVRKGGAGQVEFIPHFIHDDSGVGCSFTTADINKDGRVDIIVGGKKGTFVHLQRREAALDDGSRALFDGTTLAGWEGDPKFWSVKDGVITGESTAENPLGHNTFLLWRAGRLADFELKLKFRLTGVPDANGGIQFRSQDLGNFSVKGYQADIDNQGNYVGVLWDEHGRDLLGPRGVKAVYDAANYKTEERYAEEAPLKAAYKPGEWNDYTITAAGEHITLAINGVITTKVIDRAYINRKPDGSPVDDKQPKEERELQGHLALQLHSGGPTKIEFKDIRLAELPGAVRPVE